MRLVNRCLSICLACYLFLCAGLVNKSAAKVVEWKAPETTVKLDITKEYTFKLIYSRKALISHEAKPKFGIVSRMLPSMVVTEEELRKTGGHHHHEPVGARELAKRLVGTAKAMNGRSASGRKVDLLATKFGEKGKGVWFGEESHIITDEESKARILYCQRIFYSDRFTLSFFLEKHLKKGEDAKAIYGEFQKIAGSVQF